MVEKKISKPAAPRATAVQLPTVSVWRKLGEKAQAEASRRRVAQTASVFKRQSDASANPPLASGSSREAVAPQKAASSSAVAAVQNAIVEKSVLHLALLQLTHSTDT